ncbi:MAG: metallophosphoesterase [bacterium]
MTRAKSYCLFVLLLIAASSWRPVEGSCEQGLSDARFPSPVEAAESGSRRAVARAEGETDSVCFVNLSDLHFAYDARSGRTRGIGKRSSSHEALPGIVDALNREEALDFVVLTGDLTANPTPPVLEQLKQILGGLRVPYFVVPGNHDAPARSSGGGPADVLSFASAFEGHGPRDGRAYWSADPGRGWHLVGLDSTVPGSHEGEISARQLQWLEQDLESHRGIPTILISHHGLVPYLPWDEVGDWKGFVVRNAHQVLATLRRFPSVCLVVTGHHHLCAHLLEDDILHVSCPSVVYWPCRYSRFLLRGGRLELSTHQALPDDLVEEARKQLLASTSVRAHLKPAGMEGEEVLRLFMGPERVVVPLPRYGAGR